MITHQYYLRIVTIHFKHSMKTSFQQKCPYEETHFRHFVCYNIMMKVFAFVFIKVFPLCKPIQHAFMQFLVRKT